MKKATSPEDLRTRTKRFALQIICAYSRLPRREDVRIIARQFLRSGTSVGAHYREACRARSNAEFISKLEVALQEIDETTYWIELLIESRLTPILLGPALLAEADQLIRILITMVKNAKSH